MRTIEEANALIKTGYDKRDPSVLNVKFKAFALLLSIAEQHNIDIGIGAEHDEIFFGDWSDFAPHLTDEQLVQLGEYGIGINSDHRCFHTFT